MIRVEFELNLSKDATGCPEKAEKWRAYTASMLYQSPAIRPMIEDVSEVQTSIVGTINHMFDSDTVVDASQAEKLEEILKTASNLGAQMKCQRGYCELDFDTMPGDTWDSTRMGDIRKSDDNDGAKVDWVISRGIVKRPWKGSNEVDERICPSRVILRQDVNN